MDYLKPPVERLILPTPSTNGTRIKNGYDKWNDDDFSWTTVKVMAWISDHIP